MQGRVSIVIPTYNDDREHLAEAVASARAQTYPNVEVVVVDDGSDVPVQLDGVRVIRQDNAGPSAARNTGIRATSAEVVICLDADDRLSPTTAAEAVDVLADPAVTIAAPRVQEFGAGSSSWGGDRTLDLRALGRGAVSVTSAFRVADWQTAGGYDETLRVGLEDYEFFVRLLAATGGVAAPLPSAVHHYRVRPGSRSKSHPHAVLVAQTRARMLRLNESALRALLESAWEHGDDLAARLARPSLPRRLAGRVRRAVVRATR